MSKVIDNDVKKAAAEGWKSGEYPSKSACAKAFGVSTRTLGRALDKWFSDTVEQAYETLKVVDEMMDAVTEKHEQIEPTKSVETEIQWDYNVTRDSVTLFDKTNDKDYVGSGLTPEQISQVIYHVQNEEYEEIIAMIDMGETIRSYTAGHLTVCGDSVMFNGFVLDKRINDRIVKACRESRGDLQNIVEMFSKLIQHNDTRIIEELYDFIAHNDIEIDKDGDLIAWKVISEDWKDCRTNTIDNSIGAEPEMPRSMVNNDKNQTCSTGLHVCAKSYISYYKSLGDRVVKVKLNPVDVVSVPVDYSGAKLRCCKYKVLEEVKGV